MGDGLRADTLVVDCAQQRTLRPKSEADMWYEVLRFGPEGDNEAGYPNRAGRPKRAIEARPRSSGELHDFRGASDLP